MTPNPLHGAIDETQPHSATEGGVSEKPTMREALIDIAERAECTDDDDFRIDLEDRLKTIAETARAALAAEEESGWRTMDSAPKDGTDVLVWRGNRRLGARPQGVVRACWWQPTRYEGKWVTVPGLHGIKPTHWRPLPPPPSSKDEP